MSLLDVDSIDYVGVNNLFKRVYVGIFDDLDWDDEATHFALLTKKIDRYTQYIRSGKLLTAYPAVRGYPVVFEYVAMRPMTRSAEAFWKTREALIRSVGYGVRCRTVDVRHALASDTLVDIPVGATAIEIGSVANLPTHLPVSAAADLHEERHRGQVGQRVDERERRRDRHGCDQQRGQRDQRAEHDREDRERADPLELG